MCKQILLVVEDFYIPHHILGGLVVVQCLEEVLILDSVTDKVLEKLNHYGDPFVSADSRTLVLVDKEQGILYVYDISDHAKFGEARTIYSNMNVDSAEFYAIPDGHSYDLLLTSNQQSRISYVELKTGSIRFIEGKRKKINFSNLISDSLQSTLITWSERLQCF